jgi:hypothetical protein
LCGRRAQAVGAVPPAAVIEGMERMGFHITHVYGLTEVYGPASLCLLKDEWAALGIGQPCAFVFGERPRTATGKVQKFLLRERAHDLPTA